MKARHLATWPILTLLLLLGAMASASAAGLVPSEADPIFRAPADSSADTGALTDHRWRVQAGAFGVIQSTYHAQYLPTINLDHRWTWLFPHEPTGYAIGPLAEAGVSILLPYAKAGIEMRLNRFFLDMHGGVTVGVAPEVEGFMVPVFYGSCAGYMFDFNGTRIELEAGFNATTLDVLVTMPYATIALAW
jgi:hypothetical protein